MTSFVIDTGVTQRGIRDRLPIRVAVPLAALGHEYPGWAEIDLPTLAYLAGEIMAEKAA